MAKRSSTIYLEDKFWDMLTDYQEDNNLTSRNDALQLILNEWSILKQMDLKNLVINITGSTNESNRVETAEVAKHEDLECKNPAVQNGMRTIFGSMK